MNSLHLSERRQRNVIACFGWSGDLLLASKSSLFYLVLSLRVLLTQENWRCHLMGIVLISVHVELY